MADDHAELRAMLAESMRLNHEAQNPYSQETTNTLAKREFQLLHDQLDTLSAKVSNLEAERDKAMRLGIYSLGMAVMAMGGYILKLLKIVP